MADSKITALTSISTSTDPANDPLVIVDVSDTSMAATGTTKKVTLNQLLGASGTATLASATITGDLTVATSGLKIDSATGRSAFNASTYASSIGVMQSSASYYAGLTLRNSAGTYSGSIGLDASGSGGGSQDVSLVAVGTNLSLYSGNNLQYKIAHPGVFTWYDGAGGTRMTLNSTGLGVGAAPSTRLHIQNTGDVYARIATTSVSKAGVQFSANGVVRSHLLYDDGAGTTYLTTGTGFGGSGQALAIQSGTSLAVYTNNQLATAQMTLDSSGNVGVGVTPSAWWSSAKALQIGSGAYFSGRTASVDVVEVGANQYINSSVQRIYIANGYASRYQQDGGVHQWFNAPSGTAGNAITFTQAMTLDASGNLLVGTTSSLQNTSHSFKALGTSNSFWASTFQHDGTTGSPRLLGWRLPNSSDSNAYFVYAVNSGGNCFNVFGNGSVTNSTGTYGTISDLRLKENISDARNYLSDLLKLRVVKYSLKSEQSSEATKLGFIAQEVEQVFPTLVETNEDDVKSIKTTVLIPMLLKALQELTARVQTLETR